jgi:hypothetical protein
MSHMTICPTCGKPMPVQKIHCPKHDVLYDEGEQCYACKEGQPPSGSVSDASLDTSVGDSDTGSGS